LILLKKNCRDINAQVRVIEKSIARVYVLSRIANKIIQDYLVARILSSSWSTVGFRRLMRPSVNASRVGFSQKSSILSSMDVLSLAVSTSMLLPRKVRLGKKDEKPHRKPDPLRDVISHKGYKHTFTVRFYVT